MDAAVNQTGEIVIPLDHGAGALVLGDEGIEFQVDTDHGRVEVIEGPWPDMYLWAGIFRVEPGTSTVGGGPVRALRFVSTDGAQLVVPCERPEVVAAICADRLCPSGRRDPFWTRVRRASREMGRRDVQGDQGHPVARMVFFALFALGGVGLAVWSWITDYPQGGPFELVLIGVFGVVAARLAAQLRQIMRELEALPLVPPGGIPGWPRGWRSDDPSSAGRAAYRRG